MGGTESLSNITRVKSAMSSEMRSIGLIKANVNVKVLILWIKRFYRPGFFECVVLDRGKSAVSEVFIADAAGCSD
jgi:hypothetical protein